MVDKQFFAKIGVFLLLGVNVGAYYVFWPGTGIGSKSEAKAPKEETGAARLLPVVQEKPPVPVRPKELSVSPRADAAPLSISSPAKKADKEPSADDAVLKLLEHIKKETEAGTKISGLENLNLAPGPKPPSPPLSFEPHDTIPKEAQTPILPANLWLIRTESVGKQKQLIATLCLPGSVKVVAEFRILCDRIETKSPGGDVQAIGNVMFTGAGLKGACQRLTVLMNEPRLAFEEQVYLTQETVVGSSLRGERIVWDLAAPELK